MKPSISKESASVIVDQMAGRAAPTIKKKWWGHEVTHFNEEDLYCCKALHMSKGGHTSSHFHKYKHETLYVAQGTLTLECTVDRNTNVYTLSEGEAWVVPPGYVHRLLANIDDVIILESSTYDTPEDSIRVA